jgi:hypothetical protein
MNNLKQIELTKPMADAIRSAFVQIQTIQVEIQNLQQRLLAVQTMHAAFMNGVIRGAGYQIADFQTCGVWNGEGPDEGKFFLRAQESQVPPGPQLVEKPE